MNVERTSEFEVSPSTRKTSDKRTDPRIPVPFISVKIEDDAGQLSCVMLNLSSSGTLVQAPKLLRKQSIIKMSFVLPDTETTVSCTARVMWSRNVYEIHSRLGLKFEHCEPSAKIIAEYIENQIISRAERMKRAASRTPAPFIAAMIGNGREHLQGAVLDISSNGILIQTSKLMEAGSVVSIAFMLPDSNRLVKCKAKVVWNRRLYGDYVSEGFEFVGMEPEAVKSIEEYVAKQCISRP